MKDYIGKDYRSFWFVDAGRSGYVDLYDLSKGDYFMEYTYPEVYCVTGFDDGSEYGINAKVVVTHDITRDQSGIDWFYIDSGYAPCLVKLEPKEE